jgi:NADP-dependent 3-hydroxy acid dehydrogenase YdfG
MRLTGRTALVTGASRGIGAAIARRLVAEGARVGLVARSAGALEACAAELGPLAFPLVADVAATDGATRIAARFHEMTGAGPDALINNAGAFFIADIPTTTLEQFHDVLALNLVAPFALARALVPAMRARGSGHVVSIGSVADRTVFPGNGAYAASKHGLRAFHEVLREELRGSGVRATLVSPGAVDTELWDPIDPDRQPGFTPRAMMLSPDAVADAVLYALLAPATVNVDELRLSRA